MKSKVELKTRRPCNRCSSREPGDWKMDAQPRLDGRQYVIRVCECGQVQDRMPYDVDLGGGIRIQVAPTVDEMKAEEEKRRQALEAKVKMWKEESKAVRRRIREMK